MGNKFQKGDLVRCNYDFITYYDNSYYSYPYNIPPAEHIGIVMSTSDLDKHYWGGHPPFYGPYYEVLCLDGRTRYFIEEELQKIT